MSKATSLFIRFRNRQRLRSVYEPQIYPSLKLLRFVTLVVTFGFAQCKQALNE